MTHEQYLSAVLSDGLLNATKRMFPLDTDVATFHHPSVAESRAELAQTLRAMRPIAGAAQIKGFDFDVK